MTTYSYSQLEGLWEQAGGSAALAPVMAAIAMAESSGNSNAYNPSGATGLWQIKGAVNPADQSNLTNPQVNAKEAVLKYNSQGLGAWVTYTSGAYKQYLQGGVAPLSPSSAGNGTIEGIQGNVPGVSPTGYVGSAAILPGGQTTTPATPGSIGFPSLISGAAGLLRDVATALDYFFGMFGRGQGWRLVFTAVSAVALFLSYKCLAGAGAVPQGLIPSVVPVPV